MSFQPNPLYPTAQAQPGPSPGGGTTPAPMQPSSQPEVAGSSTARAEGLTSVSAVQELQLGAQDRQAAALIRQILTEANIDPDASLTQSWLLGMGDTPSAQLALLNGPGGQLGVMSFLNDFPEVSLTRPTPYSEMLAQAGFGTEVPGITPGSRPGAPTGIPAYARADMPATTISPAGFEYSSETGAIRFANGTIVTTDGAIIFDPSRNAPGSPQWLRSVQSEWDAEKIEREKSRLVEMGYLTKEQAKGDGWDIGFVNALTSYWTNYYINGGKPLAAEQQATAAEELPPLVDYRDISSQIQNDMRDQFRRILGTEPTEDQVRAFSQYVMRTGMDLQRKFRRKEYGAYASTALTEATETAIGQIETSEYAEDVRENTELRDALQNAAYVTRGLIS